VIDKKCVKRFCDKVIYCIISYVSLPFGEDRWGFFGGIPLFIFYLSVDCAVDYVVDDALPTPKGLPFSNHG
jgi:hypothetical protein